MNCKKCLMQKKQQNICCACWQEIKHRQQLVSCGICNTKFHRKCTGMVQDMFRKMKREGTLQTLRCDRCENGVNTFHVHHWERNTGGNQTPILAQTPDCVRETDSPLQLSTPLLRHQSPHVSQPSSLQLPSQYQHVIHQKVRPQTSVPSFSSAGQGVQYKSPQKNQVEQRNMSPKEVGQRQVQPKPSPLIKHVERSAPTSVGPHTPQQTQEVTKPAASVPDIPPMGFKIPQPDGSYYMKMKDAPETPELNQPSLSPEKSTSKPGTPESKQKGALKEETFSPFDAEKHSKKLADMKKSPAHPHFYPVKRAFAEMEGNCQETGNENVQLPVFGQPKLRKNRPTRKANKIRRKRKKKLLLERARIETIEVITIGEKEFVIGGSWIEIIEEEEYFEGTQELTSERENVINNALSRGNPGQVLVDKFRLQITKGDIATLSGLNWLNDKVIDFYMNMLMERGEKDGNSKVYAFNTFFYDKVKTGGQAAVKNWTRQVDVLAVDYILIPVHLRKHWCLAVIDFKQKDIQYYDSMGRDNQKCLNVLKQYLCDESADKKKTEFNTNGWKCSNIKDIPQQKNGSDCGMFACKYAEYITREAQITFTQADMPCFRREMVYEIVQAKLLALH